MPGRHALLLCLSLLLAGCASIGPPTLRRDRLDYADALADAAKRETLLNIIKLRYADTPSLVTVNQLVAGYTLEGRVDLRSDFFTDNFDLADDVNFGVGGTFSDRPTVTYTPIKGDDFARVMLTPIPPSELFAMLAAGAPADLTLGLAVQSINGLSNWTAEAGGDARLDAAFVEVIELLGELRRDGVLGLRFDTQTDPAPLTCSWKPRSTGRSSPECGGCSICSASIRACAAFRSGSASARPDRVRSASTRAR